MRLTLKTINDELRRLGNDVHIVLSESGPSLTPVRGGGFFVRHYEDFCTGADTKDKQGNRGPFCLPESDGYFYFWKGDANNWLDRTVYVPRVSNLTLEQWIDEFNRLKKLNDEMLSRKVPKKKVEDSKSTSTESRKPRK